MQEIHKVCIIKSKRIPFVRSSTKYMGLTLKELMKPAMDSLVTELELGGKVVGEVVIGAVNKHAYDFSLARECVMNSELSAATPATDIQKACGTSLEAVIILANKIALGQIDTAIAGGVDTNSDIPMEFKKDFSDRLLKLASSKTVAQKLASLRGFSVKELLPKFPAIKEPRTGKSMGQSCEEMARTWEISREEQDLLTFNSHQNALKALKEGFFKDLITPFMGSKRDSIIRDTPLDKLAKLKPAFDKTSGKGTLSAANSSALTDGASCLFLCSETYAKENGLEVEAYLTFTQSAAVNYIDNEGLLMAPAYAISTMLDKAKLNFSDFDFYEIHEAFAAQVLCTLKALNCEKFCKTRLGRDKVVGKIDLTRLNTMGGSLAIGHPFAATGTRIVGSLAKLLKLNKKGRGLISICTAGGMGITAILESTAQD